MTYPAYPAYKDSGVAWLGDVPLHWTTTRLSYCATVMTGGTPDRSNLTYWDGGIINWMSSGEVNKGFIYEVDSKITPEGVQNSNARLLPVNSVMVALNGQGKTKATAAILKVESTCNQSLAAIICNAAKLDYLYLYFYLQSRYKDLRGLVGDDAREGLNLSLLKSVPLYCPPLPEQAAIAAFLDRETAKIAALIAKQERLIALLGEKRQALITHAVTKGLRADAPMKDSGVAWLGEIPAHWTARRTRSVARLESGHTPSRQHPEYWENCTLPWISLADVWQLRGGVQEYIGETKELISELGMANSAARLLPTGTVIVSRTASVGFSGIMAKPMATTQDFVNWVCGPLIQPEFLLYVFRSMQPEFQRLTMGSTHKTIYMPEVFTFTTPVPPREEQAEIVSFIRENLSKLDTLIAKAQQAIALMREHRTSLIAAAVTGKIDVRGVMAGVGAEVGEARLAGVAR